jgi:hypothetical protein
MVLDATNAGNNNELQMGETFKKIKENVDKQWREILVNEGLDPDTPIIYGPLDVLVNDEYDVAYENEVEKYISEQMDIVMQKYLEGEYTDEQFENMMENGLDEWWQHVEGTDFTNNVMKTLCLEKNGLVVRQGDIDVCSFPTKEKCDSSYVWPLTEDSTYVEWRDGKCVIANPTMREICEDKNSTGIAYDYNRGFCMTNEEYCKENGGDWKYNSNIGANDCKLSTGQKILEFVFGTTLTRGIKELGSETIKNLTDGIANIADKIKDADLSEIKDDSIDLITGGSKKQGESCNINENCSGFNRGNNPSLVCHAYKCVPPRTIGQSCDEDVDCVGAKPVEIALWDTANMSIPGRTYNGVRCVWKGNDTTGWNDKRKVCANKSGYDITKSKFVAKNLPNGSYCDGNDWCESGNCGTNNRCQPKQEAGTNCFQDTQCKTGACAFYDPEGTLGKKVSGWTRKCCPQNSKAYNAAIVGQVCNAGLPEGASCRDSSWCPGNMRCIDWKCKPAYGVGHSCESDSNCSSNKCALMANHKDKPWSKQCCPAGSSLHMGKYYCNRLPDGYRCVSHDYCAGGRRCVKGKRNNKVCQNRTGVNGHCDNHEDCQDGLYCKNNSCTVKKNYGVKCEGTDGKQCKTGKCTIWSGGVRKCGN